MLSVLVLMLYQSSNLTLNSYVCSSITFDWPTYYWRETETETNVVETNQAKHAIQHTN